ncbi:Protein PHLOEM PROTEIN 2-LIKE [Musa troglodytarum]|uniref:Protein PHLOEM PROTEIN 2-LIKE n=1 Tax=Musa troglodytarum TaxID=320322 RepID=A0A9E7HGS0_9LILI|nr:Protein PHLOEM PROTEIN 2-LIKE [Musa troglodytarum]
MALQFASVLDFSRRRRRWLLLAAAVGVSGYGAYRFYHLPSVSRKRKQIAKLVGAIVSSSDSVSSSAEVLGLVSSDLNRFLRSDVDEIPASLRQLAKIAKSEEFSGSVSRVSEAVLVGIVRGFSSTSNHGEKNESALGSFSDRFFEKLFSPAGFGFASVVVGSFARNLVIAFYSKREAGGDESVDRVDKAAFPEWFHLLSCDDSRKLIADCIQRFVSTAVTVYLEKTMTINAYDQIFSGFTNPKHEAKVKDILVSVCNGAVETLVRTSHQRAGGIAQEGELDKNYRDKTSSLDENEANSSAGWVNRFSSTLAVPSNRRLVLDVTGRVTFETVRSFLDFLSWKLCDSARKGVKVAREEVVERAVEVVRYVSAKSMALFTICLTLCLQLCVGTRLLTPV